MRLTKLVSDPLVEVVGDDFWMPRGRPLKEGNRRDKNPAKKPRLGHDRGFVPSGVRNQLLDWWLTDKHPPNTPKWHIASTCRVEGEQGLLLVEAKAHTGELSERSATKAKGPNLRSIGKAIRQANDALTSVTGGEWDLSRDHHYQIANRFAWSWKLASLGIPVVLVYLGFLHANEMRNGNKRPFSNQDDWADVLKKHTRGIVDEACWKARLEVDGIPLRPMIRTVAQPLLCG